MATPDVDGPVSYELMAQDTIMSIEGVIGQPVYLLGVSFLGSALRAWPQAAARVVRS